MQIKTEFEGCFAEVSVDKSAMTLRNVALCGLVSKNNRTYTREALQSGASKYEGVRVYLDHPSKESERQGWRSVRDLAGKIENARFDGSKVRGDIVLLGNEGGKLTFELANQMPEIAGMSHNAFGKYRREDGQEIVESIERVVSVDVVTEPATNDGFFESILNKDGDDMEAEQIAKDLKSNTEQGVTIFDIESQCINTDTGGNAVTEKTGELSAEQIAADLKG